MKQIIVLVLLLNIGYARGQKLLPLPTNGKAGKCYKQCLKYDSTVVNPDPYAVIPPFGWEEVLLQNTEAQQRFEIEAPRFDTVLLKIPVDKVTRMAELPDEYGLVTEKIKVQEDAYKWVKKRTSNEELGAKTSNCIAVCLVEIPAEYKTIQKLVLKASTHQRRYDNLDSILFKQVIEIKALMKTVIEIPPHYEQVFKKLNPHASYSAWKEFLSCDDCGMNQVREIQEALKKRGYVVGELDNIMGVKTKAACIRFQKDNNLETGNLNIATLRALGLFKDEDLGTPQYKRPDFLQNFSIEKKKDKINN
jgi:hypothetical protein